MLRSSYRALSPSYGQKRVGCPRCQSDRVTEQRPERLRIERACEACGFAYVLRLRDPDAPAAEWDDDTQMRLALWE